MKLCAIIPSHNHHKALASICERVRTYVDAIFIIDDGSDEPTSTALASLQDEKQAIFVHRLKSNRGKGAAVIEGFHLALGKGFSHAFQIDADGQHNLEALPKMVALARDHPSALISGQPIYDASIPNSRKIGRWVTHIWVWIETLSFRITDSMCGFRIYPLLAVKKLMEKEQLGHHMEFDTEIMVRLFWRGTPSLMVPVKVTYPPGNISNFDVVMDNLRITKTHTRLFLTMIIRLPSILLNRPTEKPSSGRWAMLGERGAYWGIRFCATSYKFLGAKACRFIMMPIVFYFYLTGGTQRRAIKEFLVRALKRAPTFLETYQPFMNFSMRALDVVAAWNGSLPSDIIRAADADKVAAILDDTRGGLLVVSHLGNVDVMRAFMDPRTRKRVTILVHTLHATNYNRLLKELSPNAEVNLLQVTEIGPETIIHLKQSIESGGWVVIAGDRTAVLSQNHASSVPFLGDDAPFPHGPWILGALLECPVYLLFCLREGEGYRLTMEVFAEQITLPRQERIESLKLYAASYAKRLEHFAKKAPFQWYNFFDFWAHR